MLLIGWAATIQTKIFKQLLERLTQFCSDMDDFQKMNPTDIDFSSSVTMITTFVFFLVNCPNNY